LGIVAAGDGVVGLSGLAVCGLVVGFVPIDDGDFDGGDLVRSGVTTDVGLVLGVEVVGVVRVQAVNAIDPSPISNLKYFTLNLMINIE
jgi:hypothetical protein